MECSSSSRSYDPSFSASHKVVTATKDHKKVNGGRKSGKGVKLSTDAQSVAARERRHRISERFKILQSLVPGGSKMDTVSMLEEAIQYVKFLKSQIWLHQSMINYADADPNWLLLPNYISPNQSCTDLYAQQAPNVAAEADALPQLGFPHSAYSSYDEETMAMPFDPQML